MSKIKEELVGYEGNQWIGHDDHVKVSEVAAHILYAMTVAEMQQTARQHLKHDMYTMSMSDFERLHYDTIGVHTK